MKVFDLVVVGAGILGTSHALQAARLGKRVALLEKDNPPFAISGRWYLRAWADAGRSTAAGA